MTHTYQVTGMTCGSCEAKVKSALLMVENITHVEVSRVENKAIITMDKHIAISDLQKALDPKYQISATQHSEAVEQTKSWLATYKPLLLIFAFITFISLISAQANNQIHLMHFMRNFMAGFFLAFSFFKLLDIKGFAESYAMYDIIAKQFKQWGYIYPFLELILGIAFLVDYNPVITNWAAIILMGSSIIGVLQSVLNKQKIQCACLGSVFKLPMSTVTIVEDGLMIAMSAIMLGIM